ncbi:MAG: hypothetical protein ABF293_07220 [Flavobacteriaceae bacterium]
MLPAKVRFAFGEKEHEALAAFVVLPKAKISYITFLIFWFVLFTSKLFIKLVFMNALHLYQDKMNRMKMTFINVLRLYQCKMNRNTKVSAIIDACDRYTTEKGKSLLSLVLCLGTSIPGHGGVFCY